LGRWLSKDSTGFEAGDGNLYRYVMNNPVNFRDPIGLAGCQTGTIGTCGQEVGPTLRKGLRKLEEIFGGKKLIDKLSICMSLYTAAGGGFAWDIRQFFNTGEPGRGFFTKGDCGTGACNKTVTAV